MISKTRVFEKYLNYLLLFLFPTQLALHLWPEYAFVYGIRIDYLSPTIYLTDLIFITLFIFWFIKNKRILLKDVIKARRFLFIFLIIVVLNTFNSVSFPVSLHKWLKIIELFALGYYVSKRTDVFSKIKVSNIFFIQSLIFSLIGIFQVIRGQTVGGLLYYLGERSFSVYTPGIALVNVFGNHILRAYSTFPHPNSLAGFVGAVSIYLIFNRPHLNKTILVLGSLVIVACFVLSFSLEAFVATVVCVVFYLIFKNWSTKKRVVNNYLLVIFFASIFLMFISNLLIKTKLSWTESTRQRLELSSVSSKILKDNWLIGTGLNTFSIKEVLYTNTNNTVWFLQPVHNIYLLVFVEVGIVGLLFLYLILNRLLNSKYVSNKLDCVLIAVFILTTGMFDHYWFTIQQNIFLLTFITGLILQRKYS